MDSRICYVCGVEIKSTLSNFRHLKNKHNIVNIGGNVKCLESGCSFKCFMVNELRNHLQQIHNIQQDVEEFCFKDMKEFIKWKDTEEIKSKFSWVKHRGSKDNRTYYMCNRSGKKRIIPTEKRDRMLKSQGSCKTDSTCTSSIILKKADESIKIKYYKTHYGHDIKIAHIPLQASTKSAIATQLMRGIPVTEILDKIRDSVDSDYSRLHLITRKDIHNIPQAFNVYDKAIKHPNNAVSVDLWVTEATQRTDKCVILYKKQGHENEDFLFLDFCWGL